jgi:type IV pilus assembly protein PilE
MVKQAGFSLIELLVVLAIISILSTIAYPFYTHYIVQSKRLEGQLALLNLANSMEQYAIENNAQYTGASLERLGIPINTEQAAYQLAILEAEQASYSLVATPNFEDAACKKLLLNHVGERSSEGAGATQVCWGGR